MTSLFCRWRCLFAISLILLAGCWLSVVRDPLAHLSSIINDLLKGDETTIQQWMTRESRLTDAIYHHPFNQALYNGSLTPGEFERYLQQDRHYLLAYAQSLSLLEGKLRDDLRHVEIANTLAEQAAAALALERTMQCRYRLGELPQSVYPVTREYIDHLALANQQPAVVHLAALLPCFKLYQELGQRMTTAQLSATHPYREWLMTYRDPTFVAAVKVMEAALQTLITQSSIRQRQQAYYYFKGSVRFEKLFFDQIVGNKGDTNPK